MSGYRMGCVVVMLGALVAAGGVARAPSASEAGCTLEKQIYTCNWPALVQRLNKAHTVAIETESSMDRFTARQLRELVGELGGSLLRGCVWGSGRGGGGGHLWRGAKRPPGGGEGRGPTTVPALI